MGVDAAGGAVLCVVNLFCQARGIKILLGLVARPIVHWELAVFCFGWADTPCSTSDLQGVHIAYGFESVPN